MAFDAQAAKAAGYSDAEIADYLATESNFDIAGARSSGYSDADIIGELSAPKADFRRKPGQGDTSYPAEVPGYSQSQYGVDSSFAEDQISKNVLPDMSGLDRIIAGYGGDLTKIGLYTGNKIGLVDDATVAENERLARPLERTVGGASGGIVSGVVNTLVPAGAATRGVGLLGRTGARVAANPVGRGLIEGATQGALTSRPGETLTGALTGGGFGGILPGGVELGRKIATGAKRTAEAQRLLNQGVDLTPGQMNPSGVANQLEESFQSVPVVGQVIGNARQNARLGFQQAAGRNAAVPGTPITATDPDKILQQAYESFQPLYREARGFDAVVPTIVSNTAAAGTPLSSAFKQAVNNKQIVATPAARKRADAILQNELGRTGKGSDLLLDMRSSIRDQIRQARTSSETLQRDTANLLEAAEGKITEALESQLPKKPVAALRAADAKYGDYKTLESAIRNAKDRDFTPNDLSQSVASANSGQLGGQYARGGGGPLRDLASDARTVLDSRSPPTGQRLATIALSGLAATEPVTAGLLASYLGLVGTKTGRKLAQGRTAPQLAAQRLGGRINKSVQGAIPDAGSRQDVARLLNLSTAQLLDRLVDSKRASR